MEHEIRRFNKGDLVKTKWSNINFVVLDIKLLELLNVYVYTLYSPEIAHLIYAKENSIERVE